MEGSINLLLTGVTTFTTALLSLVPPSSPGCSCVLLEMLMGVSPFRGRPECRCSCDALTHRNFLVFLGLLTLSSLAMLIGNIVSDLCVAAVDPRIRFDKSA